MSQPVAYIPQTFFLSYQGAQPWFPGQNIDVELDALQATTDQIRANLALIQRDDGALANSVVTYNSLSPTLQTAGLAPLSVWVTATRYAVPMAVVHGAAVYQCAIGHTSGTFATDLAAGDWTLLVDFAPLLVMSLDINGLTADATPDPAADYAPTYDTSAAGNKKVLLNKFGVTDADFLVKTAHAALSAERAVTDTASIVWDWATAGQAKATRAALTGDVTASADSNATTIANDAVTFAKMQNIATDSLLGRDTAATGDPENILLNATLSMDGAGSLQRAALTGDVTASAGSNATTIAAAAVTFAKIQNIATDSLLGRDTAASGVVETILLNATLSMDGAGNLQRAALTGDVTASAGSNATTIAAAAVTLAKMANIATDSLIGRDTAGSGVPESILLNATLSMDGAGNLQRAALTGDVTASAGSNVMTIANDAVTYAKMQNVSATSRVLGRITAAAGDPEELTGTDVRTIAGLATSDTPQFTGIEVGHASDTTLTRSAAGVIAVEGVVIPSISSTNTLSNKRLTPRVTSVSSSATPACNTDNTDLLDITALAVAVTSMTTNLSGTPANGDKLLVRFKDNGTARAITWGASFAAKGVALPTTTVISKELLVGFVYTGSIWGCVASAQEA